MSITDDKLQDLIKKSKSTGILDLSSTDISSEQRQSIETDISSSANFIEINLRRSHLDKSRYTLNVIPANCQYIRLGSVHDLPANIIKTINDEKGYANFCSTRFSVDILKVATY